MKTGIHPKYYSESRVVCSSCGTTYEFGSTLESMNVAICAKCHPFYTGEQQTVVDTANKISSFKEKVDKAAELRKRREEIEKQRAERQKSKIGVIGSGEKLTLRDLLKANSADSKK
jgi:large subunit ribosomal protein L31